MVDWTLGWLRKVGIFVGSLVAAGVLMTVLSWLILIPMGAQLRDSGAMPIAGALMAVLTIILGGLIYRDILERDERPD